MSIHGQITATQKHIYIFTHGGTCFGHTPSSEPTCDPYTRNMEAYLNTWMYYISVKTVTHSINCPYQIISHLSLWPSWEGSESCSLTVTCGRGRPHVDTLLLIVSNDCHFKWSFEKYINKRHITADFNHMSVVLLSRSYYNYIQSDVCVATESNQPCHVAKRHCDWNNTIT
jgi:hypothetical protein